MISTITHVEETTEILPKALVHNAAGEWLAKFPSTPRDGSHDVIGLEAVCLELARRAGLEVPESHLEKRGRRRELAVRGSDSLETISADIGKRLETIAA